MKTTVDIDEVVLRELKALQEKQGQPLGRVVSDLLRRALRLNHPSQRGRPTARWVSRAMRAKIDLADKEAVFAALER